MDTLASILPRSEDLLALEPEELAGVVLQCLNSDPNVDRYVHLNSLCASDKFSDYPEAQHKAIIHAVIEAWTWLQREGLIAPEPGQQPGYFFISRRGRRMVTVADFEEYRKSNLLPRQLLHPQIATRVWAPFLRGEYDIAVFVAFKQVEIQVRAACGFMEERYGTALMRDAFNIHHGPLRDPNATENERQAMSSLFAGAIGLFKNPTSHRSVNIQPDEAVETIMLASRLLKIVEAASCDKSS